MNFTLFHWSTVARLSLTDYEPVFRLLHVCTIAPVTIVTRVSADVVVLSLVLEGGVGLGCG